MVFPWAPAARSFVHEYHCNDTISSVVQKEKNTNVLTDTDRGRALGVYQLQKPCGCLLSIKKQTLAQFEDPQYTIFPRSPRCTHQVLDPPVVLGRDNHCTYHCGSAAKIHQSANPPTASVSPAALTHLSDVIQYWPLRVASHRHQPHLAPKGVLAMDVASTE